MVNHVGSWLSGCLFTLTSPESGKKASNEDTDAEFIFE